MIKVRTSEESGKKNSIKEVNQFCIEEIPFGSKIILYGAGKSGERFFYLNLKKKKYEIVAVADIDAENIPQIFCGIPVIEPSRIKEFAFEYVLITIEDCETTERIKKELVKNGIEERLIRIPKYFKNNLEIKELLKFYERNIEDDNERFFLFYLPEHGNVGDYAIGYSEIKFLKHFFEKNKLFGITVSEWLASKEYFKEIIMPKDVIFFNGGGYFGDLWGDSETYKEIVESFPTNIKIFFPNTLTYKKAPDENNQIFMQDMKWVKKQKKLYVFFREKNSYDKYIEFAGNSGLYPDMALLESYGRKEREYGNRVLLCFRNDREKNFFMTEELEEVLKKNRIEYDLLELNNKRYVSQTMGRELLKNIIECFQRYDCIITDRLHGMIIAVTSNVPCIAFDNATHKVKNVWRMIENEAVYLADCKDVKEIPAIIDCVKRKKQERGEYKPPIDQFVKLKRDIETIIFEDMR